MPLKCIRKRSEKVCESRVMCLFGCKKPGLSDSLHIASRSQMQQHVLTSSAASCYRKPFTKVSHLHTFGVVYSYRYGNLRIDDSTRRPNNMPNTKDQHFVSVHSYIHFIITFFIVANRLLLYYC